MLEKVELSRITLCKNHPQDAEEIFYAYASKPEATKFLSWQTHNTIDDSRSFLKRALWAWKNRTHFSYAVRLNGSARLIGACGCSCADGVFQLGYVFSPVVWGKGFATEASRGLVELLLKNPAVRKITSFVDQDNSPSIHVLEKIGFMKDELVPEYYTAVNQNGERRAAWLFHLPLK